MIRTIAAKVTDENLDSIIEDATHWNANADWLKKSKTFADENHEDLYAIFTINYESNRAILSGMLEGSFIHNWQAVGPHGYNYQEVELIKGEAH